VEYRGLARHAVHTDCRHEVEILRQLHDGVWGNTGGGLNKERFNTGLLSLWRKCGSEKLIGWKGATIHNNWFWMSGRDASQDLLEIF